MVSEKVSLEGHLIDSGTLSSALDAIVAKGGEFSIEKIELGKKRGDISRAVIEISCEGEKLQGILDALSRLGASLLEHKDAVFIAAEKDCTYPENFYSTTNLETHVMLSGKWKKLKRQRMDTVIVLDERGEPLCRKFRDIKKGDKILVSSNGVKTTVPKKDSRGGAFGFMSSDVSSERNAVLMARILAGEMKKIKACGGRIVVVPGPAVVHTGGNIPLASMIKKGYFAALLSGNATAAHDIETSIVGTSLGVHCQSGAYMAEGNRNHIAAINRIFKAGSIANAVKGGILTGGIFYECVKSSTPFCLAASIRDDGPLPDVITDAVAAQKEYYRLLDGADMVIMLASTLHSVAVGNMIPAKVKTICVDINPRSSPSFPTGAHRRR